MKRTPSLPLSESDELGLSTTWVAGSQTREIDRSAASVQ